MASLVTGLPGLLSALVLCGALSLALGFGQRIARSRAAAAREGDASTGITAMNGAVFGLLGLLIAFTFSGAATRFEGRRTLIGAEANAIGTAYQRLELLKPEARATLQQQFRRYVELRLAVTAAGAGAEHQANLDRVNELQNQIWSAAVTAAMDAGGSVPVLVLPAMNEMIDITTTRAVASEDHPPHAVYVILIALALLTAVLAGTGLPTTDPNWLARLAFVATLTLTIFITLDLEYPRLGFIRIDEADHVLVELRQSMK